MSNCLNCKKDFMARNPRQLFCYAPACMEAKKDRARKQSLDFSRKKRGVKPVICKNCRAEFYSKGNRVNKYCRKPECRALKVAENKEYQRIYQANKNKSTESRRKARTSAPSRIPNGHFCNRCGCPLFTNRFLSLIHI